MSQDESEEGGGKISALQDPSKFKGRFATSLSMGVKGFVDISPSPLPITLLPSSCISIQVIDMNFYSSD
jgi:hypothetical protein